MSIELPEGPAKIAIAYTHGPRSRQRHSCPSRADQRAAIQRFATAEAFEIVAEFSDWETNGEDTLMGRPGLAEALDQARKLKAPIIAARLDRLTRNINLLPELIAEGVPFFVAGLGGGDDALVLHSYAALSEKERAMIGVSTREALTRKPAARPGNRTNLREAQLLGGATRVRAADAFAAKMLPIVLSIREAGMRSTIEIANELNARGISTSRRGGTWHSSTVSRLLNRAARWT